LTALLVAAVPLWVACIRALAGDRPPVTSIAGVLVGFGGVATLLAGHGAHGSAATGALLIVVAASMAWACGSWLQPRLPLPADPFVVVCYEMLIGGTLLSLLGTVRGEHFTPRSYSVGAWLAWAYLLLVGSVLALTAYNWLLRATSVPVAATYAYVNPVIAVFLGWLLLREPASATTLLCATVVVLGVALVLASEGRHRSRTTYSRKEHAER
jgi:drug/metabolite transporter (DMT)-like permease